jgi:hypothetical protein
MSLLISHIYTNFFPPSLSLSLSSSRLLVVNTHLKALNFTFFFPLNVHIDAITKSVRLLAVMVVGKHYHQYETLHFTIFFLFFSFIYPSSSSSLNSFLFHFFSFYDSCTRFTQLDDYIKFEAKKNSK